MKKFLLASIFVILIVFAAGCKLNFYEMGIPFVPTITNTPKPTVPNTPTPTYPPKTEFRGEVLESKILADDSTLFTDPELGYQANLAPEWLVLLADSPIEAQLTAAFGDPVPDKVRTLVSAAGQTPGIRMIGLDYTFKYSSFPLTYLTLAYTTNPEVLETEMLDVLEDNIQAVPTRMPEADVIYQNVQTNAQGLEFGKMILTQADESGKFQIKQVVALFKVSNGLLLLTGSAPEEQFGKLETVFQKAIDSVQPIE